MTWEFNWCAPKQAVFTLMFIKFCIKIRSSLCTYFLNLSFFCAPNSKAFFGNRSICIIVYKHDFEYGKKDERN